MKEKEFTVHCPGLFTLLTLLFIALRLLNVITWSWLWVLAPVWLPISIAFLIACVVGIHG